MKHFKHTAILVVLLALSANTNAQLMQAYRLPQGIPLGNPSDIPTGQGSSSSNIVLGTTFGRPCNGDEVRNVLGECVLPDVSRNIFVYAAPKVIPSPRPRPILPKPEVNYNFVFVKTADQVQQNDPIIVPPPQQKTLVYVLSKKQEQDGDSIIEAPYFPAPRPEVFYVNYEEGDNPKLPGGVDLEAALNSGATQGQNLNFQNLNFGTSQNQGNNIDGNIIDDKINTDGLVSPVINSLPIEGGFINGGAVRSDILLGGSIPVVLDSGFAQGFFAEKQSSSALLQNPTVRQIVQDPRASLGYPPQTPSAPNNFSPSSITSSPSGLKAPPLPPTITGQNYENKN